MRRDRWLSASEDAFREFMKALNRDGGGILFEALSEAETDSMVASYCAKARMHLAKAG